MGDTPFVCRFEKRSFELRAGGDLIGRGPEDERGGQSVVVRLREVARLCESGVRAGLWPPHDVWPALSGPDRETISTQSEVARGFASPNGACHVALAEKTPAGGDLKLDSWSVRPAVSSPVREWSSTERTSKINSRERAAQTDWQALPRDR